MNRPFHNMTTIFQLGVYEMMYLQGKLKLGNAIPAAGTGRDCEVGIQGVSVH